MANYKALMKRYDLYNKAKKVFDECGDDPTKWKAPQLKAVVQSLREDGDPKLPTRMAPMLEMYEVIKGRRVEMEKPVPPEETGGADDGSEASSASGNLLIDGADGVVLQAAEI